LKEGLKRKRLKSPGEEGILPQPVFGTQAETINSSLDFQGVLISSDLL